MNKKVRDYLDRWRDNSLINEDTYNKIVSFEENTDTNQKSKVARAITLLGGLFLLSGLIGTLPLLWTNLAYWAQLLLLIVTTYFLFYAGTYSEKIEGGNLVFFKSGERASSFLFVLSTIALGITTNFILQILDEINIFSVEEDVSILISSIIVLSYATYLFTRTKLALQHVALFYSLWFFLDSLGALLFPYAEPWTEGLLAVAIGTAWGLNTWSSLLQPSWLGYFLSSSTIAIGMTIIIETLIENDLLSIILLIIGSIVYVWASIELSEQIIFFIGALGLIINLPRLITEILPDDIWLPLILFLVGAVLIVVGLYLNRIRENIKTN